MKNQAKKHIIHAVGIGPGIRETLTDRARDAIEAADVVIGYKTYCEQIDFLLGGKKVETSGMRSEVARCNAAIDRAVSGHTVAVVSSGDAGIYGMAGLLLELLEDRDEGHVDPEVVPGVTAAVSAAAVLGAPLMNDFAAISLSDLLTPRELILSRLKAVASADLVCALYNPRSRKRQELFEKALDLFEASRGPDQPCGLVRHAGREDQSGWVGRLADLPVEEVDMSTIVIIGGKNTELFSNNRLVTRRGYETK